MTDSTPQYPHPSSVIPTAAIADAAVRLGMHIPALPPSIQPLIPGAKFAGPAMPVTHLGSVDVIIETIDDAPDGAVLVIDNGGRRDEACIGDLIALEAKLAGLSAIIIWGLHRDTAQLREIGLPIFSLGAYPYGPRRIPPAGRRMSTAFLEGISVSESDYIVADDDGVLVVGVDRRDELFALAASIIARETAQAERMRAGTTLRAQLAFADYRRKQDTDTTVTLRRHLHDSGSAIET